MRQAHDPPPTRSVPLRLAPNVHGVMIDADAVFLDVAASAYFCIPAVGAVLQLQGGQAEAVPALARALCEGGLAQEADPDEVSWPARATIAAPTRTARALIAGRASGKITWRRLTAMATGLLSATRRRTLQALLPADGAPAAQAPSDALLDDLAVFRRILPWLPVDGACLFRSGLLRAYLQRLGHRADWVFAVRTWPFRAHCWLQAGDVALDDEAERLIAYHPIMVR